MSSSRNRPNAHPRLRLDPSQVWEDRTTLVKREVDAERAATDAKTARLRALRLAKEAADRETAAACEVPAAPKKTTSRKIAL